MTFKKVLAGIAVRDIEAAKPWYSDFFGAEPTRMPMASDVEWDFSGTTVQVFEDRERAGQSSVTLEPHDLSQELTRLADLGHTPKEQSSGTFEIAIFEDPDGNRIVIAQTRG